jgi:thymidylate synthase ThyX
MYLTTIRRDKVEETNFVQIPEQSEVSILDQFLVDPEDRAMIQALYSRSSAKAIDQIKDLREGMKDSEKFMDKFYVGYAHKSIGDCAETTLFIENVSMLAAKAIQDNALYRGQECSTRYIDFTEQRFHTPNPDLAKGEEVQRNWRDLYLLVLGFMTEHFDKKFAMDMKIGAPDPVYKNAVKAKALDVARGFLPAGTTTNLSWTTDFRQCADKLEELLFHPLAEVREIADKAIAILSKLYPGSFEKLFVAYNTAEGAAVHPRSEYAKTYHYPANMNLGDCQCGNDNTVNVAALTDIEHLFKDRQRGERMPKWLRRYGTVTFQDQIDFGSFRDLQRHRAAVIPNVMLNVNSQIHPWYLGQVESANEVGYNIVLECLNNQRQLTEQFLHPKPLDEFEVMYYLPMGTMVDMEITMDVGQMIYMLELRSYVGVHPTVRTFMEKVWATYVSFGLDIPVHVDNRPSGPLYLKRGTQTITKKED